MSDLPFVDLKAWRQKYNITQRELVKLFKIGLSTITRIESGAIVKRKTLNRLIQGMRDYETKNEASPNIAVAHLSIPELKAWREKFQISQVDLSNLVGISVNTIANFETGKTRFRPATLAKIIKTMNDMEAASSTGKVDSKAHAPKESPKQEATTQKASAPERPKINAKPDPAPLVSQSVLIAGAIGVAIAAATIFMWMRPRNALRRRSNDR